VLLCFISAALPRKVVPSMVALRLALLPSIVLLATVVCCENARSVYWGLPS